MAQENTTVTMNVSLPEALKAYVDGKVASGDYGTASEFVREAIREKRAREQELREAYAKLEALLVEGLDSGKGIVMDADYFAKKKAALLKRVAETKKKG